MKRVFLTAASLILPMLLVAGCGVPKEEYNKVSNELAEARAQIQSLEILEANIEKELSEVRQNLDIQNSQLLTSQSQRDSLNSQLLTVRSERDNLNSQLLTIQSERNNLNMEVALLKKQLSPYPDHASSLTEILNKPEFMSATWKDRGWEWQSKVEDIGRIYHRTHTYILNETDCNDMVVDLWNMLFTEGIKSAIAVGNLDKKYASFSECNHAWLLVFDAEGKYVVLEPTTGEVFYKPIPEPYTAWSFIYKKPSDLWADLKKRW